MNICPVCQTPTRATVCEREGHGTVSTVPDVAADPLLGTIFEGRYQITERLGEGGMGVVYLATQLNVNRPVAIKLLRSSLSHDLKAIGRFQQEARAVAAFNHPHIVALHDFGRTEAGQLYLVTEFIGGRPLTELIENEAPLTAERVIDIGYQIADALIEAHSHGVIHRDLKPDNILLRAVGRQQDFATVLDFGIAKVSSRSTEEITLTKTGMAVGTPKYIAPEQAAAQAVSHRTDLYALGVILYEMLTGRLPFLADSQTDYMIAHVHATPDWPMVNDEPLRGPLVDVIMQCLEKSPHDRPASATALADLLDSVRLEAGRHAPAPRSTGQRHVAPTAPMDSKEVQTGPDSRAGQVEISTIRSPILSEEAGSAAHPPAQDGRRLPPPPPRTPRKNQHQQVGLGLAAAIFVILLAIVALTIFADHVSPAPADSRTHEGADEGEEASERTLEP
jgi:eukaryotic-like serine/threonine-protein kinase